MTKAIQISYHRNVDMMSLETDPLEVQPGDEYKFILMSDDMINQAYDPIIVVRHNLIKMTNQLTEHFKEFPP